MNTINANAANCYTKRQETKQQLSFVLYERPGVPIVELLNMQVVYAESYYNTSSVYRTYYSRNFWYAGTVVGDYRKPKISLITYPYHYNQKTAGLERFSWSPAKYSLFPACDYRGEVVNEKSKTYHYATARTMQGKWSLSAYCSGAVVNTKGMQNSMSLSFK